MAIVKVQVSAEVQFSGSLTATPTLTGVTAGNMLAVVFNHNDYGNNVPTYTVNDGTAYTQAVVTQAPSYAASGIFFLPGGSVSSGTHTATITALAGIAANSFGAACLVEISGLDATTPFDKSATNSGADANPLTGSTATLSSASQIVLTAFGGQGSLAGATDPPAGTGTYIDLYSDLGGFFGIAASQIVAATTAVNANLGTLTTGTNWAASLATFKAASGSATLTASNGAYAISGKTANFTQILQASAGTYAITGVAQNLIALGNAFTLLANSGTYNYIGAQSVSDYSVTGVTGLYALIGGNVLFPVPATFAVNLFPGTYAISGPSQFLSPNAGLMPNVVGIEYFQALAILKADSLLSSRPVEVRITQGPASTRGYVIAQSVPPGTHIAPHTVIILTVNKPQGQFPAVEQNEPIPYWYFLTR